ncbi:30S ribosomal protein S8 [Candidatus Woesearchaeota archaeon]|nr:30S ribosomal protein S8 [Candidatus Woesearchaeota archaeon]MBW3018222.1 30S ribosomal protein S8 [Candidatus Woesearchaeota archaeon]
MVLNDTLANALSLLSQHEKLGRKEVLIKPQSKMIKTVLKILHKEGYVGDFEEVEDGKGGCIKVHLIGKINNCGVIKPRFSIQITQFEENEKRFLPAKGFGVIIVSTSKGLMTHNDAIQKKIGGALIAYCY